MSFMEVLTTTLKQDGRFTAEDGSLLRTQVREATANLDAKLLASLMAQPELREHLFVDIDGVLVFDKQKFTWIVDSKDYLPDSYTAYRNKVGLAAGDRDLLSSKGDVCLVWPYKDCTLAGGQDKDDQKREEIFYNEVLAPDEVSALLRPKALKNAVRYSDQGASETDNYESTDNILIKANNLLALASLRERFAGAIKCVFIDPPYYFTATKPSDTFSYNSNFKLSTWLVFMRNRLRITRDLMSDDGVLYMTMSDQGAHYLKVLTDEVFGMENFIADVTWSSRKSMSSDGLMSENTNHVLVYSRSKKRISKNDFRLLLDVENFKFDDNDGLGKYRLEPFDAPGVRNNLSYPIENPNTGEVYFPPAGRCWRTEESTYRALLSQGAIRFGVNGTARPQLKVYYSDAMSDGKGKAVSTLWADVSPSIIWDDLDTNTNATKHLQKIFGETPFTNPKPEDLVKRAIELSTKEGDIVLDYFLGSGTAATTAHKMHRQYIAIDQMDYIETTAVERLKAVIAGEDGGISKDVNWTGGGSFTYCELAENNQHYLESLQKVQTTEEALALLSEITNGGAVRPSLIPDVLRSGDEQFAKLNLDEQIQVIAEIIDKNRLYLNAADIDDEANQLTESDRAFTKSFYGIKEV